MRVISNVLLVFPFKASQINSARQGFSLICLSLADMKEEILNSLPKDIQSKPLMLLNSIQKKVLGSLTSQVLTFPQPSQVWM